MNPYEYQKFVEAGLIHRMEKKPERPNGTDAFALEMVGEVGEFINALKHEVLWLKAAPTTTPLKTLDEAGDVLWYLTAILSKSGLSLNEAMVHNTIKLQERYGYGNEIKTEIPSTAERGPGLGCPMCD